MNGTIHLIAPSAPPKICGVGDHSLFLGKALGDLARVRIHCGQHSPPPDFGAAGCALDFRSSSSRTLERLALSGDFARGDVILFQYTNFAYGRYGFNPRLAPSLRAWRARGLVVATMFHETFTDQPGPKGALMRFWQRIIFRHVGLASHLCLFSVEPWTLAFRPWFPRSRVETLRVGSNIPRIGVDREQERRKLAIPPGVPVLGVFGGTHPSRLFDWITAASNHLDRMGVDHRILRIGPDSEAVKAKLSGSPLIDLGILEPQAVSRALSCCDVFLSPISDGASSRRGSLLAGLGHGLPCVTTIGPSSDQVFRDAAGHAIETADSPERFADAVLQLVASPQRREALAQAARSFHDEHFSWEAIAGRLVSLLAET